MDSSAETKLSFLEEYEETAIELAEVRCRYSKKIEDYLSRTTKAELANLKKISYKTLKTTTPKVEIDFKDIPKCMKDHEKSIFPKDKDQYNTVEYEKEEMMKLMQKLKSKIPIDDTQFPSLVQS